MTRTALAMAYLGAGHFTEAVDTAGKAITAMETSGTGRDHEALARSIRVLALTESGDPVGGMVEAERALRCCLEGGNRYYRTGSYAAAFARAAAATGTELDRALQVLDEGEQVAAHTGARGFLPELLDARARVHATRGEHDARRDTLRRGSQLAGENGAHGWEERFDDALTAISVGPPGAAQAAADVDPVLG